LRTVLRLTLGTRRLTRHWSRRLCRPGGGAAAPAPAGRAAAAATSALAVLLLLLLLLGRLGYRQRGCHKDQERRSRHNKAFHSVTPWFQAGLDRRGRQ